MSALTEATADDRQAVWLDCDPGHDDAIALLLAFFAAPQTADSPSVDGKNRRGSLNVLGVSTTHGNAGGQDTYRNAVQLLAAYGIGADECRVWRGADRPLMRAGKADVGIHGESGLGGVVGLPGVHDQADDRAGLLTGHLAASASDSEGMPAADPNALVSHQIQLLAQRVRQGLPPITLIATGPLTNVALLWLMSPGNGDLVRRAVKQVVLMGGAAATSGNRTPLAEWNILVDPEAASIVFDCPVPVVMAGLNVTHQAIFTPALHRRLVRCAADEDPSHARQRCSLVRQTVSSALTFFADTYATEFGFVHGPPIHDMLTVAYVLDPTLFFTLDPRQADPDQSDHPDRRQKRIPCERFRVQIDVSQDPLTAGTTVVDYYDQWDVLHDDWHKGGRNAVVLEYVDTQRLWPMLFEAVDRAERALGQHGLGSSP